MRKICIWIVDKLVQFEALSSFVRGDMNASKMWCIHADRVIMHSK